MCFENPNLKRIVAVIAVIAAFSLPVGARAGETGLGAAMESEAGIAADTTNEADLLQALAAADPVAAKRLERQLQSLWSKSGSASMDLLLRRGRDALKAGDTAASIEHLTALTDHAPDFAEGWNARAAAYFNAGLYGPALDDLERALALNPNNYAAIFGLGTLLETFGDKKRAYQAYLRAQAIHPNFKDVVTALDRLKPEIEGESL
jgi:tetratricopeptide (TPR) repeat protein